jgi:hypothetical protein
MSGLRVIHLHSVNDLRGASAAWDDLWQRSETTFPTMRAELLAQWLDHFVPEDEEKVSGTFFRNGPKSALNKRFLTPFHKFHAIAIQRDDRWMAALPLVERKKAGLIRTGVLPCNEWSSSGDFLFDPSSDADRVMEAFLNALSQCGLSLLWLDEVILESARWPIFMQQIENSGIKSLLRVRWKVGRLAIQGDWKACQARWSRKHRQHMAWLARQLEKEGKVELALHNPSETDHTDRLMRQALEIENSGWKGRTGGSVLSVPGMSDFFIRQARQLAAWGQLEIAILKCGEKPIAFCYGQNAKGVFHSAKVGYDPQYARFSPGQLLRYFLLMRFHDEPQRKAIDFLGPMSEAHARWRPEIYTVARFAAALRPMGRIGLWAYRHWPAAKAINEGRAIHCPVC